MTHTVRTVCSLDCPDACGVLVTVESDAGEPRAARFRGDPTHEVTRGFLCGKVNRYEEIVYHPDRILWPLRRSGPKGSGRFERISWDDAIDEIAERLLTIRAESGGEAIAPYYYGGTMGLVNRNAPLAIFHWLGATTLRPNICYHGAEAGYSAVVGSGHGVDPQDIVHSDLIVIWGANPVTTQVHLVPVLEEARRRGARWIAIDPYRNRTARSADDWIAVRPGTDAALALGLLHVLEREGLLDDDFIRERTVGFERLSREILPRHDPDSTARATGVPRETILELARRLGGARAPLFKVGVGLGRSATGGSAVRAVCCLAGGLGAWRHVGGGVQYDTGSAFGLDLSPVSRPDWLRAPTRTLEMTGLARALEDWRDPPLRALWIHGSNPAATAPEQTRLLRGLAREDLFTVVHERFLTDSARFADIVLPAVTFAESEDLFKSYGHLWLQYGRRALPPRGESRSNHDVVRALGRALGIDDPWLDATTEDLARAVLERGGPTLAGLDVDRLLVGEPFRIAVPRGRPGFEEGFPTPSGRLEFASASLEAAGGPTLVDWREEAPEDDAPWPLRLVTPPAHAFLSASFGPSAGARRREGDTPSVLVHPDDARDPATGEPLRSGDRVEIHNELGAVELLARVTEDVAPGTLVAEGIWWPSHCPGGRGINVLASDRVTDLGRGAVFHDIRVALRRAPATSSALGSPEEATRR